MAQIFTDSPFTSLLGDCCNGIFDLFICILQALLIAVTGFTFARAPAVSRLLDRLASIPKTQGQTGVTVMLATAVTSLLS